MARDIPKAYEPQEIEQRWAQEWFDRKLYTAGPKGSGPVFSIAIPPPNVTGSIHIGHMLEHTQIDILVRWHRMRGFRTLWLPGCDHAGIATQVVVERELAKQGLQRVALGREEFERRVWEWKAASGGTIKKQMIRLGASCDWSRERFTLDPPLYRAVLEAFLRLYREGLIYRGRYIVNWCPRCMTALSDLETVHEERGGHLWFIRYPVVGAQESIVVATTRPETMLGDTAVAVHPEDERYRHLVGKRVLLPLMNREIPVVADSAVDPEFGTGAVKVTPAHDPNDFEIGRRHSLAEIEVMTEDGRMSAAAGKYAGLDRFDARKRVVADLQAQGLVERIVDHTHAVGICQRCKTVVEPRLSIQWFCKMKPLAYPAMQVVREGLIPVVPDNQRRILLGWLENIRDWCISRQLWWGHRIPVWHCGACGAMTPARDSRIAVVNGRAQAASPPEACEKCGARDLTQDPDVLDTWFSSALWPFSTLGWPDETEDLRDFYPTTLLISGYDILFFWDARMIMMGLKLMPRDQAPQRIPFRQLSLHGLVRDPHGVKMSKTRGNVVDPLEVIEKQGTDALRFALAIMAAPGTDIALSEDRILSCRAFANKIWNAVRFLFVNLEKLEAAGITFEEVAGRAARGRTARPDGGLDLAERWIFSRMAAAIEQTNRALAEFRFHEAAHAVYHFFWGDICDWYLEWMKPRLEGESREDTVATWRNLFTVLEAALRLLHPFMPFLTEELWTRLPQGAAAVAGASISLEKFPEADPAWRDAEAEKQMELLQGIIAAARHIRAEMKLDPRRRVAAELAPAAGVSRGFLEKHSDALLRLAYLSSVRLAHDGRHLDPARGAIESTADFELLIPFDEVVDREAETAKLRKELERLEKDIQGKTARLGDQAFRSKAPAAVVSTMETVLEERRAEFEKLRARLGQLEG
ncbi:MAG TPA: valine--tRNA ligase [Candidatus Acidoferrales bacterium]|nr:valine--tRNA ligase [Candidatus Acidoferrales bacterium]